MQKQRHKSLRSVLYFFLAFLISSHLVAQSPAPVSPATETTAETTAKQNLQEQKEIEKDFSNAFAENSADPIEERMRESGGVSWFAQVLKTFLGLVLIVGFFYLLMRLYRFQQKLPTRYSEVIKVHHQYPLAAGKQIQILEIGRRLLVVAVSDAGVQLLTEIDEKSEVDGIKLQSQRYEHGERPDFLTELSKAIKNTWQEKSRSLKDFKQGKTFDGESSTNFDSMRRSSQERLERLKRNRENLPTDDGNDSL